MAASTAPTSRLRWLAPGLAASLLVVLVIVTTVLIRAGREEQPPVPGTFVTPTPVRQVTVVDVQQTGSGGALTVSGAGGNQNATPRPDLPVFVLQPGSASRATAGDWVVVSGIPNEVLNFTIRQVTIIPAALGAQPDAEGIPRLPDTGLSGYEASRDSKERPVLAGRVSRVDGSTLLLDHPTAPITVDAGTSKLVRVMTRANPAAIREGDRIAYYPAAGSGFASAAALLVLPAGQ